jgi:hypothetical protein
MSDEAPYQCLASARPAKAVSRARGGCIPRGRSFFLQFYHGDRRRATEGHGALPCYTIRNRPNVSLDWRSRCMGIVVRGRVSLAAWIPGGQNRYSGSQGSSSTADGPRQAVADLAALEQFSGRPAVQRPHASPERWPAALHRMTGSYLRGPPWPSVCLRVKKSLARHPLRHRTARYRQQYNDHARDHHVRALSPSNDRYPDDRPAHGRAGKATNP